METLIALPYFGRVAPSPKPYPLRRVGLAFASLGEQIKQGSEWDKAHKP